MHLLLLMSRFEVLGNVLRELNLDHEHRHMHIA